MNPDTQIVLDTVKDVENPFTLLALAAIVGAIVRVLKTKKAGDIFDAIPLPFIKRIPKEVLPWCAVAIAGVLAFLDAKLNAGLSWRQSAILGFWGAVLSGGTAIGGNETIAKLLKQFIPGSGGDGPKQVAAPNKPEPPKLQRVSVAQMALVAVIAVYMVFLQACAYLTPKNAKDGILTASDIACVEESPLLDADETAVACGILRSPITRELLKRLIGQREAGKRAGYHWQPLEVTETVTTRDAGAKDAASRD